MAKYTIDYHEPTGRFFIKYGGEISSHKLISKLLVGVRSEFGPGRYSMTRKARKNHG